GDGEALGRRVGEEVEAAVAVGGRPERGAGHEDRDAGERLVGLGVEDEAGEGEGLGEDEGGSGAPQPRDEQEAEEARGHGGSRARKDGTRRPLSGTVDQRASAERDALLSRRDQVGGAAGSLRRPAGGGRPRSLAGPGRGPPAVGRMRRSGRSVPVAPPSLRPGETRRSGARGSPPAAPPSVAAAAAPAASGGGTSRG